MEHILVVEKEIGRYLEKGEIVHHIDGNRQNNSSDNLLIVNQKQHSTKYFDLLRENFRLKKLLEKHGIIY